MLVVADIECDGFCATATVIHCLCVQVLETDEVFSFADHPGYLPINDGLDLLEAAEFVIGHSFLDYDAKVIKRLRKRELPKDKILDTLEMSKSLIDIEELTKLDYELHAQGVMPLDCVRRRSLESWGYRLGRHKNGFGKTANWRVFSHDMVQYCIDDVLLNADLYRMFERLV